MPARDHRFSHVEGRVEGKVAVVTGGGCTAPGNHLGTGAAISLLLAAAGAKLCVVDRETGRAETTCGMIADQGGEAVAAAGDVTRDADCAAIIEFAVGRFGAVDILVNNVGVLGGQTHVKGFEEADWDRVVAANLKSAVLMSRHAIPVMATNGGGAVVNIASIAALQGFAAGMAYGPSKAALVALTRELAVQHGRDLIRVNAIAPGHLFTPMVSGLYGEAEREARRRAAPLGIEGDAWDVAAAALFLASDEARFVTAACLAVDGGVSEIGALAGHALIMKPDPVGAR